MLWDDLYSGQEEAQSTTQAKGLWQVCAEETAMKPSAMKASTSYFPNFISSQTYPT